MPPSAQIPLGLGHRVALGREDFLVAASNRLAAEWVERWPDWPFSTLVLVGPPGCGKTHLGHLWRARAGAESVELGTLRLEQAAALAEGAKAVLVDDADRAVRDPATQTTLLHLYNLLRAAGGHLLLTADRPPSEWNLSLADLASRLNSAMVIRIGSPDDALLSQVALKLFADRQLAVGEDVIALLVTRGERSFAAMANAVEAIDRAALSAKRPVTAALAREILGSI